MHQGRNKPGFRLDQRVPIGGMPHNVIAIVEQRELYDYYLDDEFHDGWNIWYRYHMGMGLPFTGGWAEQPAHLIDIVETFESAHRAVMAYRPKGK